jgi:hypothetical protein
VKVEYETIDSITKEFRGTTQKKKKQYAFIQMFNLKKIKNARRKQSGGHVDDG